MLFIEKIRYFRFVVTLFAGKGKQSHITVGIFCPAQIDSEIDALAVHN